MIARFRPILNAHGITEQQWRIVRALIDTGPLEPREIGELCRISSPSLAGVLSRMEELGYIRRKRLDHDQRRLRVSLTPRSRALAARMAPQIEATYRQIETMIGADFSATLLPGARRADRRIGSPRANRSPGRVNLSNRRGSNGSRGASRDEYWNCLSSRIPGTSPRGRTRSPPDGMLARTIIRVPLLLWRDGDRQGGGARRSLLPPRGAAVEGPPRGRQYSLHVSRLAVRQDRQMRGDSLAGFHSAGRQGACLPGGRALQMGLDLDGRCRTRRIPR